jgi:hypothetical protein
MFRTAISGTEDLSVLVFVLYALGSGVVLARMLIGQVAASELVRGASPFVLPEGVPARFSVRLSRRISVPIAVGWFSPTVLLPTSALGWSAERLTASVLHEEAHLARRDLIAQALGALSCMLHWPNPLIWRFNRMAKDLAEQATDDCVLREGVDPAAYASILVETAAEFQRSSPAAAVGMARSNNVKNRVSAILGQNRARGAASLLAVAVIAAIVGTVTSATSLFGVGLRLVGSGLDESSIGWQDGSFVQSHYTDIREGKTTQGDSSNGFAGTTADGRKVEILQIQRWTPHGVEAWRPDGTPVPASSRISIGFLRHNPAELNILTQVETSVTDDSISGGLGSGRPEPGDPTKMTFAGGYVLDPKMSATGTRIIDSFIQINKPGSSGLCSFTFALSEGTGQPIYRCDSKGKPVAVSVVPDDVRSQLGSDFESSVSTSWPDTAKPFVYGADGNGVSDGHGGWKHRTLRVVSLSFTVPTPSLGDLEVTAQAHGLSNALIDHVWNDYKQSGDRFTFRYCWAVSPDQVREFDVVSRRTIAVELQGVHLTPDLQVNP